MAKYGMSLCVLGMAEEFRPDGIAVNALWPRTGKREREGGNFQRGQFFQACVLLIFHCVFI